MVPAVNPVTVHEVLVPTVAAAIVVEPFTPESVEYRTSYPVNSVGALVEAVQSRSTAPAVVEDEVAVATGVFCVAADAG